MTYWRATVEKPDGEGGWTTVGVFGTPATPGSGTDRYLSGDTALDAAVRLLAHVWPVNLAHYLTQRDGGTDRWIETWAERREAETGISGHRITIDIDESNQWWAADSDTPRPQPQTFTVAELRVAAVRTAVSQLGAEEEKLADLLRQVKKARAAVRGAKFRLEQAVDEAVRSGVDKAAVDKAKRRPRKPRTPAGSGGAGRGT